MRRLPKMTGKFLGVLLAAVLALAPVLTFADTALALDKAAHATSASHEQPPCDMPCDGCADDEAPFVCKVGCNGVAASLPALDATQPQAIVAAKISPLRSDARTGRDREPDKPPPKSHLA